MTHTVKIGAATLACADSLQYIKTLADDSVDLIATDPPYYRVKRVEWDNQWASVADYLAWLEALIIEFRRVLKPTGSLYMFCGSTLAADSEMLIKKHFNVLNHIVWAKPSGMWGRYKRERQRTFFPATERIIFAEQKGAEVFCKSDEGLPAKEQAIKRRIYKPLIDYFFDARECLGVTAKEINQATRSTMSAHWFRESQWQLPKRDQYERLQALFADKAAQQGKPVTAGLYRPFDDLVCQYNELRYRHHENRRVFGVTNLVCFTDVWTYPPVAYYPGKHPCEKPAAMMEHIIATSTRVGDVVADFFMGSGSTVKAALKLGRRVTGVELEAKTFNDALAVIEVGTPDLHKVGTTVPTP